MSTNVTVLTSASTSILIPFTSAANAALVQGVLNGSSGLNTLAKVPGFVSYFTPDNTTPTGLVDAGVPSGLFGGVAIAPTVSASMNFGVLDAGYTLFANDGSGINAAIGGLGKTTLIAGNNATTLFINSSSAGKAFIGGTDGAGGGAAVISNAFAGISKLDLVMDGDGGFGTSTLILDDHVGGTVNATLTGGALVALKGGGTDKLVAQGGTVAIFDGTVAGGASGITTITAFSGDAAGSDEIIYGAQGGRSFIEPGAANVIVFQPNPGQSNSTTLFGGTRVIGGTTLTAPAFTGKATVLNSSGYFEAGSAGGSIMQTSTIPGSATMIAGGAGDLILVRAPGDVLGTGNGAGTFIDASQGVKTGTTGDIFNIGAGSGTVQGAFIGHNTFNFTGAGTYQIFGGHDGSPSLVGSTYKDLATGAGGAGNITIVDWIPSSLAAGTLKFDTFDIGSNTATLSAVGGSIVNTASLSDGTVIHFNNITSNITQVGSLLV